MDLIRNLTWFELELPPRGPDQDSLLTLERKVARTRQAESVIEAWWRAEAESRFAAWKASANANVIRKVPIDFDSCVILERIPGADESNQKHLFQFLDQSCRRAVAAHPEKPFLLFWGWKSRQESVRIYGGIFPRYLWHRFNSTLTDGNRPLRGNLHKSAIADRDHIEVGLRLRLEDLVTSKSLQHNLEEGSIPPPNLNWLVEKLRAQPELFAKQTFYLSGDWSEEMETNHKPYDRSAFMTIRPDEMAPYVDMIKKFFFCLGIMSAIESGQLQPSDSAFRLVEAYMIEADLSDPRERELDYKCRLLMGLFAARLMFRARSKKKTNRVLASAEIPSLLEGSDSDRSAVESVARLILQTLALQLETRHKYIFSEEILAIRLAALNGTPFHLTDNSVAGKRNVLYDLWSTQRFTESRPLVSSKQEKCRDLFIPIDTYKLLERLSSRQVNSSSADLKQCPSTGDQVSFEHPDDVTCASRLILQHMLQGINSSLRYDTESQRYSVASESIDAAMKRWMSKSTTTAHENNTQIPDQELVGSILGDDGFPITSAFATSTASQEASRRNAVCQVLMADLPVIFYLLCEANVCNRRGDVLVDAIEHTMHVYQVAESSQPTGSILFYGHRADSLTKDHLYFQSCSGRNFTMVLVPTLIFADCTALSGFVKALKASIKNASGKWDSTQDLTPIRCSELADWIYPVDGKNRTQLFQGVDCYSPGFRFDFLNTLTFAYEVHPSLAELQGPLVEISERNNPMLRKKARRLGTVVEEDDTPETVDVYQVPCCKREKKVWDRCESWRFIHNWARSQNSAIPEKLLIVTKSDLAHGSLVTGAQEYDRWSCLYQSKLTGDCKTCGCFHLMGSVERPLEHYQFINYREIPAWQFAIFLKPIRLMCKELDQRFDNEASVSDLDHYLEDEVGLGEIWRTVVKLSDLHLQKFKEFRVEMQIDHDLLRRELVESMAIIRDAERNASMMQTQSNNKPKLQPLMLGRNGAITVEEPSAASTSTHHSDSYRFEYDEQTKDRIKRYIALHPDLFYGQYKGNNFKREGDTIRWGTHGSFSVSMQTKMVTSKKTGKQYKVVAGGYHDFETDETGDVFTWVMKHHYKSNDRSETFIPALKLCHAFVLRTYGLDALLQDPTERTDLPEAAALNNTDREQEAVTLESRIREARTLWKNAHPFDDNPRMGSEPGVRYMRLRRAIQSARLLFGADKFRYHPSFPIMDRGQALRYGAVVVPLVNPADPNREIRGVHGIFLDEISSGKVDYLENQKKSRGEWSGNAVFIQQAPKQQSPDQDLVEVVKEFSAALAIGEGVETMCSVAEACPELEVWALLGLGNVGNFPYLSATPEPGTPILYCADNDKKDPKLMEKVEKQIKKLTDKGYSVHLCLPDLIQKTDQKTDFNDILIKILPRVEAIRRIRDTLKRAKIYPHTAAKKPVVATAVASASTEKPLRLERSSVNKTTQIPEQVLPQHPSSKSKRAINTDEVADLCQAMNRPAPSTATPHAGTQAEKKRRLEHLLKKKKKQLGEEDDEEEEEEALPEAQMDRSEVEQTETKKKKRHVLEDD